MSMASSELSQASTGSTDTNISTSIEKLRRGRFERRLNSATPRSILLFLIAFRVLNALCVRTFFQPDEFFQSLEPAWQTVFGKESGVWITWEWKYHLRSSIHPYVFAVVYYVSNLISQWLRLSPLARADLLIAAPKTAQAVIAAIGDYYTWKLAGRIYGIHSLEAWGALALTVLSPWQWFCSTRTFSNSVETSLTIAALYMWPWQWPSESNENQTGQSDSRTDGNSIVEPSKLSELRRLRQCLLLAALACILRPTNLIIWLCLTTFALFKHTTWRWLLSPPRYSRLRAELSALSFLRGTKQERTIFIREAFLCGSVVLGLSILMDRLYYESWTFPPFRFLYFNVAQSLAVFYGKNDWHYYFSQGYLLLLTTVLPFSFSGLYRALSLAPSTKSTTFQASIRRQLAVICILVPLILSFLSHKEVRFIYPLLPALHVLTSPSLVKFFLPAISSSSRAYTPGRLLLIFLILVNFVIAFYTTVFHAAGGMSILSYLRRQHVSHYLPPNTAETSNQSSYTPLLSPGTVEPASKNMTIGFLMPCHSTPWRTHIVFPTIHAWALSCEPPVDLNATEKSSYLDEADQFYANPATFLRHNMVGGLRHLPRKPSYLQSSSLFRMSDVSFASGRRVSSSHNWPDYLVFFAQLEPALNNLLRSSSYAECFRAWNTAWHDDWRRKGDMVVWCLDPYVQREWREKTRLIDEASWSKTMEKREKHFDRIIEGFRQEAALGWERGMRGTPPWSRTRWPWPLKSQNQWYSKWQWPWATRRESQWLSRKSLSVPYWEKVTKIWNRPSKSQRRLWS